MSEGPPVDRAGLDDWLARHFSDVATIDASALDRLLQSNTGLLLLDVRTPEEQAVSILPGAMCVAPDIDPLDVPRAPEGTPLVVYCSVGVRSARLGRSLVAVGHRDVRNLAGGIFGWANEGRPLAGPRGENATRVHGYDDAWRVLLDPARRA